MGDAIRERADQWRQSPLLDEIDMSISSVGFAMGAADQSSRLLLSTDGADSTETSVPAAGGVEAATTSVVVHYFLKSHGGAHAVQSVCSLLAVISGLGAIVLPKTMTLTLLRRCMIFAMTKHLAGILAACTLTARAVPEVGLGEARQRIEDLVQDPVAQYVFYSACILFWLPAKVATNAPPLWWQNNAVVPILFTGPILLREVISTMFVISDIILLWVYSNHQHAEDRPPWMGLVTASQSVTNALMSLVVTPKVWRSADALQRQAILARLVSKASLAFEVLVGLVLAMDSMIQSITFLFGGGGSGHPRPALTSVVKALLCTRLYINFLWIRRRKIRKLATKLRGGAAEFPMYVLNAMLDPLAAMGLDGKADDAEHTPRNVPSSSSASWRDYLRLAVGWEEDDC